MATILKMPVLGQSVEEVRILQWLKREGDTVTKGENLAEIETDKVNTFFESVENGVVRRLLAAEGDFVAVEAPVMIVGTADESIEHLLGGSGVAGSVPAASISEAQVPAAPSSPSPSEAPPLLGAGGASPASPVFLSPRARRVADEFGVAATDLAGRGTGPNGRVQEADVIAFHEERAAALAASQAAERGPKSTPLARAVASGTGFDLSTLPSPEAGARIMASDVHAAATAATEPVKAAPVVAAPGGSRVVTLTGLRKRVADNIAKSIRTAPHVTLHLSADMTEAMALRAQVLPSVEKATNGVRVSPTDIIVKATSVALREFPYVNAHIDNDTITLFDDVHIGLAVSLGEDGLIVPVIKNVLSKGLGEIARDRTDLAARARKSELGGADISSGTFTISNLGNYGIEHFNPIIAPPQVAILGVGAIADTVVALNGQAVVRPMMGLSLSFDHRAMDGAPAAAFLARLKEILEKPYLLLT